MGVIEKPQLSKGVEAEVDTATGRVIELAEKLTDQARSRGDIYNRTDTEDRVKPVATFMLDMCDFVDSLDHQTTSGLETEEIQAFVGETRQAARAFLARTVAE